MADTTLKSGTMTRSIRAATLVFCFTMVMAAWLFHAGHICTASAATAPGPGGISASFDFAACETPEVDLAGQLAALDASSARTLVPLALENPSFRQALIPRVDASLVADAIRHPGERSFPVSAELRSALQAAGFYSIENAALSTFLESEIAALNEQLTALPSANPVDNQERHVQRFLDQRPLLAQLRRDARQMRGAFRPIARQFHAFLPASDRPGDCYVHVPPIPEYTDAYVKLTNNRTNASIYAYTRDGIRDDPATPADETRTASGEPKLHVNASLAERLDFRVGRVTSDLVSVLIVGRDGAIRNIPDCVAGIESGA